MKKDKDNRLNKLEQSIRGASESPSDSMTTRELAARAYELIKERLDAGETLAEISADIPGRNMTNIKTMLEEYGFKL